MSLDTKQYARAGNGLVVTMVHTTTGITFPDALVRFHEHEIQTALFRALNFLLMFSLSRFSERCLLSTVGGVTVGGVTVSGVTVTRVTVTRVTVSGVTVTRVTVSGVTVTRVTVTRVTVSG
jgi:hypothetical protein